jgi:hypothetical protein
MQYYMQVKLDIEVWWTLCRSCLTSLNMLDAISWGIHCGEALGWRYLGDHSRHGHREDMTILLVSCAEYGKIHSLVCGCQNFVSNAILKEIWDNYPRPRSKSCMNACVCAQLTSRYLHIIAVL